MSTAVRSQQLVASGVPQTVALKQETYPKHYDPRDFLADFGRFFPRVQGSDNQKNDTARCSELLDLVTGWQVILTACLVLVGHDRGPPASKNKPRHIKSQCEFPAESLDRKDLLESIPRSVMQHQDKFYSLYLVGTNGQGTQKIFLSARCGALLDILKHCRMEDVAKSLVARGRMLLNRMASRRVGRYPCHILPSETGFADRIQLQLFLVL